MRLGFAGRGRIIPHCSVYPKLRIIKSLSRQSIDLMPGDVIFCGSLTASPTTAEAFIWTGVEVLVPRGGRIVEPGDPDVTALLAKDWFFAWRATLD